MSFISSPPGLFLLNPIGPECQYFGQIREDKSHGSQASSANALWTTSELKSPEYFVTVLVAETTKCLY